jgi:hypothetical protein
MIYIILVLSLLFAAIGFIITEENATYLLSGYNSMNEVERKQFNVKSFTLYFRSFHILLSGSFSIIGISLTLLVSEKAAGVFLVLYPILAYIYFVVTTKQFSKGINPSGDKTVIIILCSTLLFVLGLLVYGFEENELIISSNALEFEGSYGELINYTEIERIDLVNHLPKTTIKVNGFAMGNVKRGFFEMENGEIVKILLNSDTLPIIRFIKTDGNKIFYSATDGNNGKLVEEIRSALVEFPTNEKAKSFPSNYNNLKLINGNTFYQI